MNVRSDHDHLHARKARGIYNLSIENLFGVFEQRLREEQTHRHVGDVFGMQRIVTVAMPTRQMLPTVRVSQWLSLVNHVLLSLAVSILGYGEGRGE